MARRRGLSAAQKAALARGRAVMAARRRGHSAPARKTTRTRTRTRTVYLHGGGSTRRRVRGVAKRLTSGIMSPMMDVLLGAGGAVVAGISANLIPVGNPKVKSLIPLGIGVVTAATMKDKRIRAIGVGMAIAGTISTLKQWVPNVPLLAGDTPAMIPLPDYLTGRARLAGATRLAGPVHLIPGVGEKFRTSADM